MKAVLLAGGTGTRLQPLTRYLNKHLLPVGRLPMIVHGIRMLRDAGLTEILLITGASSLGAFASCLGSGRSEQVALTYRVQEEAGGIAEALRLARSFIGQDERFVLLLGDNLFGDSIAPLVARYTSVTEGAMVVLKQVDDPHRYGIAKFSEDGQRVAHIVEKPANPPSNYCVTGLYFYDNTVFERLAKLRPSARGELEITDVNNAYAASGALAAEMISGWWTDAGTFESLHDASSRLLGN